MIPIKQFKCACGWTGSASECPEDHDNGQDGKGNVFIIGKWLVCPNCLSKDLEEVKE